MANERVNLRQRGRKAGSAVQRDEAEQSAAGAAAAAEPTSAYMLSYYAAQHIGSVLVVSGISLLCFGYDKEWMHNTHLCMLSMAVCLVGLIFHELRPFKREQLIEEQRKAQQAAGAAAGGSAASAT